jgi:hypothetical protein
VLNKVHKKKLNISPCSFIFVLRVGKRVLLDKDLLVEWRVEEGREMEGEEDRWIVEEEEEKAFNKRNSEDEDIAVFTVRATIGHQVGFYHLIRPFRPH